MNILVTLDKNYIPYLNVMLFSLVDKNSDCDFSVYLLNSKLKESDVETTRKILGKNNSLILLSVKNMSLKFAPTTSRYPAEMYYRIFAAKYLPDNIDKILYLDPDIIINKNISELYSSDMGDYWFFAASHTGSVMRAINGIRLDMQENTPYINSGVMLMNLRLLRKYQNYDEVFSFIFRKKNSLFLPDQDIISSLYGNKIYQIDTFRYNMSENLYLLHSPFEKKLNLDWVRKNSAIIHYCGRNKPWKETYIGYLDVFYKETVDKMKKTLLL